MDKEQTLEFIEEQVKLEYKIIALIESNVEKLGNAFVKVLLLAISRDSKKHAELLGALKEAVAGPTPFISEEERDGIAKGIEKHIELEEKAIDTYGKLVESTDNHQVMTIASIIKEDEIKHHSLLKELHKTVISPETLTEDMIWDTFWKDSPWHGSPGG